jgi:hypothetical protein
MCNPVFHFLGAKVVNRDFGRQFTGALLISGAFFITLVSCAFASDPATDDPRLQLPDKSSIMQVANSAPPVVDPQKNAPFSTPGYVPISVTELDKVFADGSAAYLTANLRSMPPVFSIRDNLQLPNSYMTITLPDQMKTFQPLALVKLPDSSIVALVQAPDSYTTSSFNLALSPNISPKSVYVVSIMPSVPDSNYYMLVPPSQSIKPVNVLSTVPLTNNILKNSMPAPLIQNLVNLNSIPVSSLNYIVSIMPNMPDSNYYVLVPSTSLINPANISLTAPLTNTIPPGAITSPAIQYPLNINSTPASYPITVLVTPDATLYSLPKPNISAPNALMPQSIDAPVIQIQWNAVNPVVAAPVPDVIAQSTVSVPVEPPQVITSAGPEKPIIVPAAELDISAKTEPEAAQSAESKPAIPASFKIKQDKPSNNAGAEVAYTDITWAAKPSAKEADKSIKEPALGKEKPAARESTTRESTGKKVSNKQTINASSISAEVKLLVSKAKQAIVAQKQAFQKNQAIAAQKVTRMLAQKARIIANKTAVFIKSAASVVDTFFAKAKKAVISNIRFAASLKDQAQEKLRGLVNGIIKVLKMVIPDEQITTDTRNNNPLPLAVVKDQRIDPLGPAMPRITTGNQNSNPAPFGAIISSAIPNRIMNANMLFVDTIKKNAVNYARTGLSPPQTVSIHSTALLSASNQPVLIVRAFNACASPAVFRALSPAYNALFLIFTSHSSIPLSCLNAGTFNSRNRGFLITTDLFTKGERHD